MKKKGFTLMELLAVIVVLAIIALIATPIVLNLINNARVGAAEQSATEYVKSLEESIMNDMMNNKSISNGIYSYDYLNIDVSGKKPTGGEFEIKNGSVERATLCISGYKISYENSMSKKIADTCDEEDDLSKINILFKNVQNNVKSKTQEGVYYFDESGNLDYNQKNIKINIPKNINNVKGNVSIYNGKVIFACFNYNDKNYEYEYRTNKINLINYKCSTVRGENLVINGDLSYGDNTNFPTLTYSDGSLNAKGSVLAISQKHIPIDPNKTYEIGVEMKTSNPEATYTVGFVEYDVDKKIIDPSSVMINSNTLTELAQDLNNGDTVIHLKDMKNWYSTASGTYASYHRGIAFWNYKDSTGYEYPELTYTRNYKTDIYTNENIDKTNNTLTLSSPWNGGEYKAGTKVSQPAIGDFRNYGVLKNSTITNDWVLYKPSQNITGTITGGVNNTTLYSFRPGTKYVTIYLSLDNNKVDTTTNIKNIYFREVIS